MSVEAPEQAPDRELGPLTEPLRDPPSGLGQMTLAQVSAAARHYRPVLAAIAAVVLLGLALPGPRAVLVEGFDESGVATPSSRPRVAAPSDDQPPEDALSVEPAAPVVGGFDSGSSAGLSGDFSYEPEAPSSGGFDSSSSSFGSSSSPPTTEAAPRPLRVREAGWATRTSGTPLAADGVPAGSLPVAKRVGQDDKASFVRLSGNATVLSLRPAPGGRSVENAIVRACPISGSDWKPAEAMAWDDRPAHSTTTCVDGARNTEGVWTFDLSSMPERLTAKGIALVPGGGSTHDFQIAFARD